MPNGWIAVAVTVTFVVLGFYSLCLGKKARLQALRIRELNEKLQNAKIKEVPEQSDPEASPLGIADVPALTLGKGDDEVQSPPRDATTLNLIAEALTENQLEDAIRSLLALYKDHLPPGQELVLFRYSEAKQSLQRLGATNAALGEARFLRNLPVRFGSSVTATSVISRKEKTVSLETPCGAISDDLRRQLILKGYRAWRTVPIVGMDNSLIGTVDVVSRNNLESDQPPLTIPLNLFTAVFERHKTIDELNRRLRFESFLSEINHQLAHSVGINESKPWYDVMLKLSQFLSTERGELEILRRSDDKEIFESVYGNCRAGRELLPDVLSAGFIEKLLGSVEGIISVPEAALYQEEADSKPELRVFPLPLAAEATPATGEAYLYPLRTGDFLEGVIIFRPLRPFVRESFLVLVAVMPTIAAAMGRVRLVRELNRKASYDQLTGLLNRTRTEESLVYEIQRSERYGNALAVILFDIDKFKLINDTFGHDIGDQVLGRIGEQLSHATRSSDIVGRWGGEEFLLVLPETSLSGARQVAEMIRSEVEASDYGLSKPVTVSLGCADFQSGDLVEALVKRADVALYQAKESGRNCVVCFGDHL
ncbi:diguanylate cyclase (GGDEF)-like protein [Marinobacter pelagius]|uniref:diguanylate cyclase n=1 Tax=Marinobacter pelagius TaxID=379482 RepID=A0A366GM32_9GAMM|nr:GGDEF domain-containing protein [Marinobacter pelagius]RBP27020.1 diguanylate cyclase (GGDEF)-like protein [Marinobacter pelagius]